MTRRSKREVESALDSLDGDTVDQEDLLSVVWEDERTGELVDRNGDPTDPDPDALMVLIRESVVMSRDRARREDREILGPADDAAAGEAAVRVAGGSP